VHVDKRGTKKAVDDAIYDAGASNVRSSHIDFPNFGVAYDLSALDKPLSANELAALTENAARITDDPTAIRWLRSIPL
ncbi:MAG: D-3-phosphoglycerate dehydrogenase, partial [Myxococcota bacterium]